MNLAELMAACPNLIIIPVPATPEPAEPPTEERSEPQ